jgi:hypothetical protein
MLIGNMVSVIDAFLDQCQISWFDKLTMIYLGLTMAHLEFILSLSKDVI